MPNDPRISDTQFYTVAPESSVTLRVEIGDAQTGGTSVTLNGNVQQITTGGLTLGQGSELLHKVVHCITTVKDVNTSTNRTDVTYFLDGGPGGECPFPYNQEVAEDGGYARYLIDFVFV
ncbi:MAG: hypothetical protein JWM27_3571 [Gemmatimonadetes bacterium]|nr:hypothetical protein [Gemmatimonadota bacterium]